jgi:hypothetical protein
LVALELTNGVETKRVLNYGYYNYQFSECCIADDILWFKYYDEEGNDQYASMDLSNGEVTTYENRFKWDETISAPRLWDELENFTMLNNQLYVLNGGRMGLYNTQKESFDLIRNYLVDILGGNYNGLGRIYTDGTSLYAYDLIRQTVHKVTPNEDGTYTEELIDPHQNE